MHIDQRKALMVKILLFHENINQDKTQSTFTLTKVQILMEFNSTEEYSLFSMFLKEL